MVLTAEHNHNHSEQERPGHAVALGHMEGRHGDSGDRNNNRKCSKPTPGSWLLALVLGQQRVVVGSGGELSECLCFILGLPLARTGCLTIFYAGSSNNQVSDVIINIRSSCCSSNVIIGVCSRSLLTWPIAKPGHKRQLCFGPEAESYAVCFFYCPATVLLAMLACK